MIKLIRMTMALFVSLISFTAFCYGADVSGNLSVNVVSPEATPKLRGRPHIANHTIVADNGSMLRGVHMYATDNPDFTQWYTTSWFEDMKNNGHFNTVRAFARLQGNTMSGIISGLDKLVSLAGQEGFYVLIVDAVVAGGGDPCPSISDLQNFWSQIAPRYANNTNVIYEIMNEPDFCGGSFDASTMENTLYDSIRAAAPSSPIAAFSIANPVSPNNGQGVLSMVQAATHINYSNAVVAYHGYDGTCNPNIISDIANVDQGLRSAGYPTMLGEVDGETCASGVGQFSAGIELIQQYVEQHGESWAWLGGQGYKDCATGVHGGGNRDIECINVTWPAD